MKKVCVIQDELLPGGKTDVMLKLVEILNKHNIIPDLYTYDFVSQQYFSNIPKTTIRFNLKKVFDFNLNKFTYYKSFLLLYLIKNKLKCYDLIFNSSHWLYKNIWQHKLVNYIYYLYPLEYCEPEHGKISLQRMLYLQPLRFLMGDSSKDDGSKYGTTIAISKFAKKKIEELYSPLKNKVEIIYPPVKIIPLWNEIEDRNEQVVSIGNFEPKKDQLSQIKIAKSFPDVKFIVTGFVSSKFRKDYYNKCLIYIKKHKISNIKLLKNVSTKDLKLLLQRSKYFLHTRRNEHFGISTVEAIAAGCIPLVHNSGGQIEIVPFEDLRFNSIDDAVAKFNRILHLNVEKVNCYRKKLQDSIKIFSEKAFEDKINDLLNSYLE
jgi:glycosyltransferase involved in cell wall biosynthesis